MAKINKAKQGREEQVSQPKQAAERPGFDVIGELKKYQSIFAIIFIGILLVVILLQGADVSRQKWIASEQEKIISDLNSTQQEGSKNMTDQLTQLSALASSLQANATALETERASLRTDLDAKSSELRNATADRDVYRQKYEEYLKEYARAYPSMLRTVEGIYIEYAYPLLADYKRYTQPEVLKFLGVNSSATPANKSETWKRIKGIYDWLQKEYGYCTGKGLKIGNTTQALKFFSPDELMMNKTKFSCGSGEDLAMLFAGMMYASGIPQSDAYVVCGNVTREPKLKNEEHCWNNVVIENKTYTIDPICSQANYLYDLEGKWTTTTIAHLPLPTDVTCLYIYTTKERINPAGYSKVTPWATTDFRDWVRK